jgi:predicted nucleotidyltransferase
MGRTSKSKVSIAPRPANLASALFSATQLRVLGLLFGQPDRSFFATELINLVGAGSGVVQRELARLADSELVTVTRVGTQKHYQANRESPIFEELSGLIRKTVGLREPLKTALEPYRSQIDVAFIYGSIARGTDTASSDIDVMIFGDALDYVRIYAALENAESLLHRKVNVNLSTLTEWRKKLKEKNPFYVIGK